MLRKFQAVKFPDTTGAAPLIEALDKMKITGEKATVTEVKPEPKAPTEVKKAEAKPEEKEEAIKSVHYTVEEMADKIKKGEIKKLVLLTGAGISVNAGIPDFRTPGTGLYSQLEKYKLPFPEAIFTLEYFLENPEPFYKLASEMFGKKYLPTKVHYFIRLLQDKGILVRNFTQNIDNLEAEAGVKEDILIQAHGTYTSSHCPTCKAVIPNDKMMENMKAAKPYMCEKCSVPCKPDIVFFGEGLPKKFFKHLKDLKESCDLLIVIGSSLAVMPFCMLPHLAPLTTPLLVVNNQVPDCYKKETPPNLTYMMGDCDESIEKLVKLLGWKKEFEELMKKREEYAKLYGLKITK